MDDLNDTDSDIDDTGEATDDTRGLAQRMPGPLSPQYAYLPPHAFLPPPPPARREAQKNYEQQDVMTKVLQAQHYLIMKSLSEHIKVPGITNTDIVPEVNDTIMLVGGKLKQLNDDYEAGKISEEAYQKEKEYCYSIYCAILGPKNITLLDAGLLGLPGAMNFGNGSQCCLL